jgi:hypothetical protein
MRLLDRKSLLVVECALQKRRCTVKKIRVSFLVALIAVSSFVVGHEVSKKATAQEVGKAVGKGSNLEKLLWDVDQQWMCNAPDMPYYKPLKACVEFRRQTWTDQFFEISNKGQVRTGAEMIAAQSAPDYVNVIPHADQFKLMAVYGDFALATDHTVVKTRDASGNLTILRENLVLRMFAKENGSWRPAGAVQVPTH